MIEQGDITAEMGVQLWLLRRNHLRDRVFIARLVHIFHRNNIVVWMDALLTGHSLHRSHEV